MSSAREIAVAFEELGAKAAADVARVVVHHGQLLQTRVKAHASGRPGPRAVTGDYRRSIQLAVTRDEWGIKATVYSMAPQAWRLEAGFTGIDASGRHYHVPPFPHFGPAFDQTAPEFEADLMAVLP